MNEAPIHSRTREHLRHELERLIPLVNRALHQASSDKVDLPHKYEPETFADSFHAARALLDEKLKLSAHDLPLERLRRACGLTPPELDIFLLCLAPQVDERFRRTFAYLNGDRFRKNVTPDLLANLLASIYGEHTLRFCLGREAVLSHLELLHGRADLPDEPLLVDSRVVDYILGHPSPLTLKGRNLFRTQPGGPTRVASQAALMLNRIRETLNRSDRSSAGFIYLWGPRDADMLRGAANLAAGAGRDALVVRPEDFAAMDLEAARVAGLLFVRENLLEGTMAVLDLQDEEQRAPSAEAFRRAVMSSSDQAVIIAHGPPDPVKWTDPMSIIEFPDADFELRASIWAASLENLDTYAGALTARDLAGMYRLEPEAVDRALARVRELTRLAPPESAIGDDIIIQACRSECASALDRKAVRVKTVFDWSDMVLPADRLSQLRHVRSHFRNQSRLFRDWGFSAKSASGKGIHVLFSGPPGTGKTMAAAIIAGELKLEIFKVDLSATVSKYIGETEKNLAEIFREARKSNAVLFFDEADALFGKRSDVKDAHDRFANVEVSFLLQCMDDYEGITILATNYQQNMDPAFTRRIHHVIVFPFPDIPARETLWRNQFPPNVPLGPDLDFSFLAHTLKFSGGEIRNAAFQSALLAAEENADVDMERIMRAARREIEKSGRAFVPQDFAPYHTALGAEQAR